MDAVCERVKRPLDSTDDTLETPSKKCKLESAPVVLAELADLTDSYASSPPKPESSNFNKESSTCGTTVPQTLADEDAKTDPYFSVDQLPDDVLLILLSYLNSSDLVNLSLCNRRLLSICKYRSLWYRVNSYCGENWPSHALLPSYFNEYTTYMRLTKNTEKPDRFLADTCFGYNFFEALKKTSPNLKSLIFENHVLSISSFKLKHLPECITELRFVNTDILHFPEKLFDEAPSILPNLEIVEVSFSQWFNTRMLFPLGKCTKLKELKTVGWRTINEFIPYASIATISGFPCLETLDMRQTLITDREISCFHKARNLKHILLEKPDDASVSATDDSITDICTTSLGMRNWRTLNGENQNGVFIYRIPAEGSSNCVDEILETLVVRNYPRITDITLKHAAKCLKSLKYLDVTGSSCTAEQIAIFKRNRPDVTLLHDVVVA